MTDHPFLYSTLASAGTVVANASAGTDWVSIAVQGGMTAIVAILLLKVYPEYTKNLQSMQNRFSEDLKEINRTHTEAVKEVTKEHTTTTNRFLSIIEVRGYCPVRDKIISNES